MQINYPNSNVRRATAPFWYVPTINNTIQAAGLDNPALYSPYGTQWYWPNEIANRYASQFQGSQNNVLNVADNSIAPNSGGGTNVTSAAIASGFSGTPAAGSPGTAAASGAPIGPATLVAPLPSITQSPSAPPPVVQAPCNSVDSWVSQNPMLAGLVVLGAFLFVGHMR